MIAKASISLVLLALTAVLVAWTFGLAGIADAARNVSPLGLSIVFAALLANALAAALRFKIIAADVGHSIGFRRAVAAVSVGTLGGAAFFQLAGQLMARGAMMNRAGIPFASVVVMTLYERAIAAVISGLLALAGAYYLFGQIVLDQTAGGGVFIKIIVGLLAATFAGALLGYGQRAAEIIAPRLTGHFAARLLRAVALSLIVQLPMMVAYTFIAHTLSPVTPVSDLAAASTIVMFAASVPISLAGWGVREMSAVFALGAIGVGTGNALLAAVTIGAGSLITMTVLATASITSWHKPTPSRSIIKSEPIDYLTFLSWSLPIAAATLVLFQLYVPISSGTLLNVNLADPIAILGGSMFLLQAISAGRALAWRLPHMNAALAAMTAILAFSLILGATRIGYTEWAVVNRFLGWFVLLAYAGTGALIVRAGGNEALKTLLLTYVGATVAVTIIEITLTYVGALGVILPEQIVRLFGAEGFAQNHNFFAFQLLMATAAALSITRGRLKTFILTVLMAGLWFAGSRSGWIALVVVLLAGLYLRTTTVRTIAMSLAGVVILALIPFALPWVTVALKAVSAFSIVHQLLPFSLWPNASHEALPEFVPSGASTQERLLTLVGGWYMFLDHPIVGAGLGAFRNLLIPSTEGIPLLIHSTALWLMAELGIIGLAIFVTPALFVLISELRRTERDEVSNLLILCLLAFAVMSGPADMLYQRTFWILIGAGLALPFSRPGRADRANLT
jgi:hypothetical protein